MQLVSCVLDHHEKNKRKSWMEVENLEGNLEEKIMIKLVE
jgi:hypothetical protein